MNNEFFYELREKYNNIRKEIKDAPQKREAFSNDLAMAVHVEKLFENNSYSGSLDNAIEETDKFAGKYRDYFDKIIYYYFLCDNFDEAMEGVVEFVGASKLDDTEAVSIYVMAYGILNYLKIITDTEEDQQYINNDLFARVIPYDFSDAITFGKNSGEARELYDYSRCFFSDTENLRDRTPDFKDLHVVGRLKNIIEKEQEINELPRDTNEYFDKRNEAMNYLLETIIYMEDNAELELIFASYPSREIIEILSGVGTGYREKVLSAIPNIKAEILKGMGIETAKDNKSFYEKKLGFLNYIYEHHIHNRYAGFRHIMHTFYVNIRAIDAGRFDEKNLNLMKQVTNEYARQAMAMKSDMGHRYYWEF